jgi:hypothetical protein
MLIRLIALVASLVVFNACSFGSTVLVTVEPASPGLAELNRRSIGRTALIVLLDGRRSEGDSLSVGTDSTIWFTATPVPTRLSTPTLDVRSVTFTDRRKGALLAFLVGAGVGLGSGLFGDTGCDRENCDPPAASEIAGIAVGMGAVAGAIGGIVGAKNTYLLGRGPSP